VPTFKDVEESIDTFSGDDGKNVKLWIKEFEELAKLCKWNTVQKTIYAKRLLRGSASDATSRVPDSSNSILKDTRATREPIRNRLELRVLCEYLLGLTLSKQLESNRIG
ncbi:hypothetical protein ALC57_15747, partial [Trachymyrmex cornetzi]